MPAIKVTPEIIRRSLLEIFNEFRIPANGRLSVPVLEQAWRRTGLRESDLQQGISAMVEDGSMVPVRVNGELVLKLTERGAGFATSPAGINEMLLSLKTKRVLRKTRTRVPEGPKEVGKRRSD